MTDEPETGGEADEYCEAEWQESAAHAPLRTRPKEDLLLLHRHWMWANQCREAFEAALTSQPVEQVGMLASRSSGLMLMWYGMLWSVVEACVAADDKRQIDLRGAFKRDIDGMTDLLRRCRNAVFHVPRSGTYYDPRIEALIQAPEAVPAIRRISKGFGRMFLEELGRRKAG